MNKDNRHGSMKVFTIIWLGQLTSLLGTGMTTFVMTIWAWKVTGQVTPLALVSVFNFGAMMTLAPIAGTLVDRWNRRRVMIFSDLTAGLTTLVILTLYASGYLQVWHLYISGAIAGGCQAFQYPAYSAAVTMMVSKEQYTRANGMISLAESSSGVLAPIIAAALLLPIGFAGIMIFDIVTFIAAIGTLLFVDIPQPRTTKVGRAGKGNLLQETYYGIRYIYTNHTLLGLITVIFLGNLVSSFVVVVQNPMILARTGDNAAIMATVQSISAVGGVAAGLLMSLWGGPKRRIHGLLIGFVIGGLLGVLLLGLGRSTVVWSAAAFFFGFHIPIAVACYRGILMAKVPPDIQGRVFGSARLVGAISHPLSMLLGGPLADRVFEPAMQSESLLYSIFHGLVGTGPGSGMAVMFIISGVLYMAIGLAGYAFRAIRNAEDILPDHDAETPDLKT